MCSPDISIALFLKVLITVPSFLRSSGELRLSATFCFNRERTFKLGSETEQETKAYKDSERETPAVDHQCSSQVFVRTPQSIENQFLEIFIYLCNTLNVD